MGIGRQCDAPQSAMRCSEVLRVEAPAKLNVHLDILALRPDGYHDLETVMISVGLRDVLLLRPARAGEFHLRQHLAIPTDDAAPPEGPENLVLRAARLLAETSGVDCGVSIELTKRIPWRAGLGGGSSDAAATLLGLNELWRLHLPREQLHGIAAKLGSDLNFFLERCPLAVCRGRGEQVQAAPLRRRIDFVVAQPSGGLHTADVFRKWRDPSNPHAPDELLRWLAAESTAIAPRRLYNALMPAARELHAGVDGLCRRMEACGLAAVCLTGSGSACFGIARSHRHALAVSRRLSGQGGPRVWVTRSTC